MDCKYCGVQKKYGHRDICKACFEDNVGGCKTAYNRRYNGSTANVECKFKCGRKTRNHTTGICVACARSTRRSNSIGFTENFEQMKAQHEARWKRLGIIYTDEELIRHLTVTKCDLRGCDLDIYRAMDHDHETMKYRGTLCRKCNCGLGQLGDNLLDILTSVSSYQTRSASLKSY
jgi:hypothetical protein